MQKQLEGTQKYINDSVDRCRHDVVHVIIVSNTHALPAEYNVIVTQNRATIAECLLVSF